MFEKVMLRSGLVTICLCSAFAVHIPDDGALGVGYTELEINPQLYAPAALSQLFASLDLPDILPSDSIPVIVNKAAAATKAWATEELVKRGLNPEEAADIAALKYPYFSFLPLYIGKIQPSSAPLNWTGHCFKHIKTEVSEFTPNVTTEIHVTFTTDSPQQLLCSEVIVAGTTGTFSLFEIALHGVKTITMKLDHYSAGDMWDLSQNGVRIFSVQMGIKETLSSFIQTAELFEPEASKPVSPLSAAKNIDFLAKYRGINMTRRAITDVVLNETDIHSGDFFGVIRLDGLDPMLAWAMGSATGHTTVALWGEDGELYICESTSKSAYWDWNGIQKTPYRTWIAAAKAASFNVFHLPLSPQNRAIFNQTAAWEWFRTVEGLDYGYNNMFWGWIDTPVKNYPCVPPDYKKCLTWEIIETAFPAIGRFIDKFNSFWDQAFNKRLGTKGLDFGGILQEASRQGLVAHDVPLMVENDTWTYDLERDGKPSNGVSMVCCVFVCRIWKAAGLFENIDNEINCSEMTNWDDYTLAIFDANYVRPAACVEADPDSAQCQVLGDYTVRLDENYNSKQPYSHMAEKCPGTAPDYYRPPGC